jgi:hypothetical protein
MKRYTILILFLCVPVFNLLALEKIDFPKGKSVIIDGSFNNGEWNDAASVDLKLSDNNIVRIYYKHDGVNLLIAFCKNLKISGYQFRFPEVLLDIKNTKTKNWDEDDHWFHVSATDCNSKGHPKDYTNCLAVQPDWQGEKNFMDPNFNDTIEISIPFTKIGLNPKQNKLFGIAFDVTDTQWIWEYYPQPATMNDPSTWAVGEIIEDANSVIDKKEEIINIFPNPANNNISISFSNSELLNKSISIYNSLGIKIKHFDEKGLVGQSTINLSNDEFQCGVYYCTLNTGANKITKSFIVER